MKLIQIDIELDTNWHEERFDAVVKDRRGNTHYTCARNASIVDALLAVLKREANAGFDSRNATVAAHEGSDDG